MIHVLAVCNGYDARGDHHIPFSLFTFHFSLWLPSVSAGLSTQITSSMHRIYRSPLLQLQQASLDLSRLSVTRRITTTVNYLAPIEKLVPPVQPFRVGAAALLMWLTGLLMQCASQYAYPPPKGVPEHNEVLEPHQVEVSLFVMTATLAI